MLPSTSDDGSDAPLKRARRHGVVTAGKSVDHCTADMPFDGGCYVTVSPYQHGVHAFGGSLTFCSACGQSRDRWW